MLFDRTLYKASINVVYNIVNINYSLEGICRMTTSITIKTKLDYKSAGVDIDQGNKLVDSIKPLAKKTYNKHVLNSLGGFAGLFEIPAGYKQPVLVSSTDGVGTKLKLAQELKKHDTIGIDLLAMCANDIIVSGAKPLFFLDYYACNNLEHQVAVEVITGITNACAASDICLIGGETAEMPGLYHGKDYDLAGFCVGIAEKENLVDVSTLSADDVVIGLSSSGVHSNGFSLVRKILEVNKISLNQKFEQNKSLGEVLLTPTVLYQNPLCELITSKKVKACAHITGGGLIENTARIIPDSLQANFHLQDYQLPKLFSFLQQQGNIATDELWRTFNCGIGMVLVTAAEHADYVINYYNNYNFNQYNFTKAFTIGKLTNRESSKAAAVIRF